MKLMKLALSIIGFYFSNILVFFATIIDHIYSAVHVISDKEIMIESETGMVTFSKFQEHPVEHVKIDFTQVLSAQGMIPLDKEYSLYEQYGYNKNLWGMQIIGMYENELTLFVNKPFVGFVPSKNQHAIHDLKNALCLTKKVTFDPPIFFPTNFEQLCRTNYMEIETFKF